MDINELITSVNDVIWGDCLIYVLIACGLWFTWRTRFMQFRMIGEMFRLLDDYRQQKRQGIKAPTFHISQIPELENELECWG